MITGESNRKYRHAGTEDLPIYAIMCRDNKNEAVLPTPWKTLHKVIPSRGRFWGQSYKSC